MCRQELSLFSLRQDFLALELLEVRGTQWVNIVLVLSIQCKLVVTLLQAILKQCVEVTAQQEQIGTQVQRDVWET